MGLEFNTDVTAFGSVVKGDTAYLQHTNGKNRHVLWTLGPNKTK
jgi:hypothetical protein